MSGKGNPAGRLLGRDQLKKAKRPPGQCRQCFAAGLSHRFSLKYCTKCQSTKAVNQEAGGEG